jgi:hypothetical protein
MKAKNDDIVRSGGHGYEAVLEDVVRLVEASRSAASRSVNAMMTATYWGIGHRGSLTGLMTNPVPDRARREAPESVGARS